MDFDQECEDNYWRFGIHLAFPPDDDEMDFSEVDPKAYVTDTLLAYPVESIETKAAGKGKGHDIPPRIRMINPAIWENAPLFPPDRRYERPTTPDDFGEFPINSPDQPGDEILPIVLDPDGENEESEELEDDDEDEDEHDEMDGSLQTRDHGSLPKPQSTPSHARNHVNYPKEPSNTATPTPDPDPEPAPLVPSTPPSASDDPTQSHNITNKPTRYTAPVPAHVLINNAPGNSYDPRATSKQVPWHLVVPPKAWDKVINMSEGFTPAQKRGLKTMRKPFRAVAISPRGAKWVIAVGHAEMVAVWKLPERQY